MSDPVRTSAPLTVVGVGHAGVGVGHCGVGAGQDGVGQVVVGVGQVGVGHLGTVVVGHDTGGQAVVVV
ncbi:MAG TPA: hypothetical protein VHF24_07715, partial [Acidimicrobiales bacterium]|nr:hypothetical protein [Acidimicrobiales bacterium]